MMRKTAAQLAMQDEAWEMVQSAAARQGVDLREYTSTSDLEAIVRAIALDLERDQALATTIAAYVQAEWQRARALAS